jgi:predicted DNA-binding transcriptional regulator AlpA
VTGQPWPIEKSRELCHAVAFLEVHEVATVMGKSRSGLYGAIKRGEVPFRVLKFGGHRSWLVPSADILALLEPKEAA